MGKSVPRGRSGFTLVELLVVMAIIAVVLGLLLAAVQKVRATAARLACANNLKQLALGVHNYHDCRKKLPSGTYHGLYGAGPNSFAWSWLARLLPQLEEDNLYRQGRVPETRLSKSTIADGRVPLFLCPGDNAISAGPRTDAGDLVDFPVGQTNYKGVSGSNWGADLLAGNATIPTDWPHKGTNGSYDGLSQGDGMLYRTDYRRSLSFNAVSDGLSNTFMIGEDIPAKNRWCSWPYANNAYGTCAIPPNVRRADGSEYNPDDWQNTFGFRSAHSGGVQFALADGSVRFIHNAIDLQHYRALATISGGEAVSPP